MLLFHCGSRIVDNHGQGGSGTETVGIVGTAADINGNAIAGALVKLRRADFLDTQSMHLHTSGIYLAEAVSDSQGRFRFGLVDTGIYTVEINDGKFHGALLRCAVQKTDSLITLPQSKLLPTGSIFGTIPLTPQIDSLSFSIVIYGLSDHRQTANAKGEFIVSDIPQGSYTIKVIPSREVLKFLDTVVNVNSGKTDSIGQLVMQREAFSIFPPDSCVLRNILDSNGLYDIPVYKAAQIDVEWPFRIIGISVSDKNMTTLTSQIGKLSEVSSIELQGAARLSALPTEIGACKKLRTLIVTNAQLDSLPASIGGLDSLRQLCLSGNRLNCLPHELGRLQALETLDAGYNLLTSIPWGIRWCHSMKKIVLNNNFLTEFNVDIAEFDSLKNLNLDNNMLKTLSSYLTSYQPMGPFISVKDNKLCDTVNSGIASWLDVYSLSKDWRSSQNCF
jgi:hypothetical protein